MRTGWRSWLKGFLVTGAALMALFVVTLCYSLVAPTPHDAVKYFPNGSAETFNMPLLELTTDYGRMKIRFNVRIPSAWTPRVFMAYFSEHSPIDSVTVNGTGFAFNHDQFTFNLSSLLHVGDNQFLVSLHSENASPAFIVGLEPSRLTLLPWIYFIPCLCIVLLWFRVLYGMIVGRHPLPEIRIFLLVGVLLRAGYAFAVPFYVYNPDVTGHVAYVWHVLSHWTVPLTYSSWQAHQAPLYYFLAAPLAWLGERFGMVQSHTLLAVQQMSLLITILTLLIGVRVVHRYFDGDRMSTALGTIFLCTFPSFVFLSSQVNNDVLVTLFGFFWFERLLEAVHSRRPRDWCLVGVMVGLGLLTKGSALLWLPISLFIAFLVSGRFRARVWAVLYVSFVVCILAGPLLLWRYCFDPFYGLVANAPFLKGMQLLQPTLSEILTFHPLNVLSFAYRSVHGIPGYTVGTNFLDTLFITAQFGSGDFGAESSILLAFGLLLLLLLLLGIVRSLFHRQSFLPALVFSLLILGLLLYRLRFPYTSSQFFRYIQSGCLPLALLLADGAGFFRSRLGRIFSEMTIFLYALVSAILCFGIIMAT